MTEGDPQPQRRPAVYYWGLFILAAGLVASALIFVVAQPDPDLAAAEEIAKDRGYEHNLQLMGGKFAVLSAEFNQWFAGLWHGQTLAYTLAFISIAIALACFWAAHLISSSQSRQ